MLTFLQGNLLSPSLGQMVRWGWLHTCSFRVGTWPKPLHCKAIYSGTCVAVTGKGSLFPLGLSLWRCEHGAPNTRDRGKQIWEIKRDCTLVESSEFLDPTVPDLTLDSRLHEQFYIFLGFSILVYSAPSSYIHIFGLHTMFLMLNSDHRELINWGKLENMMVAISEKGDINVSQRLWGGDEAWAAIWIYVLPRLHFSMKYVSGAHWDLSSRATLTHIHSNKLIF